ncbi:MAG: hemolysin III family protein [Candidatus Omnitrophica bacterium]|nr:hemolysin III family protein [Candidatus Omnitrophota bacterium]
MGITAVCLSVVGSVLLVYRAVTQGTVWHVVSFSIYGISLIALWTVSTLYHSLNVSSSVNRTLEQLDHAMIYFLIAGTYTPVCLIVLRGGWGWSLLGINWVLAITGIVLKLVFRQPSRWAVILFFVFYIIMGWLMIIAWFPLVRVFPHGGLFWLVLGGIFYTVGAVIFNIKRPHFTAQFGSHELWHLFVMAGSFSHFWMMLKYVL